MAIRFCENEVYCINKGGLSRSNLISFFFKNDLKNIVYVTNEEGKFDGIIQYKNLINSETVEEAIQKEKVVFNEDLWINARNCFQHNLNIEFLPVVNENNELEYFCYNDPRPNYLINKIRRLSEIENQIPAINKYSNIECISIYDLNEVSYYLYQFLKKNNIAVNLYGEKWSMLKDEICNNYNYMNSSILNIYSEGVSTIRNIIKDINEFLLNDITGYFEFIDDLYSEKKEYISQLYEIHDWDIVLQELENESRPIIIEGDDWIIEKAYDYLIGIGVFPVCFCTNKHQRYGIQDDELTLFGKKIYCRNMCMEKFPDAIYILLNSKNKLCDRIEELEYQGYSFGKSYYVFTGYFDEISENILGNVISSRETILIGDSFLCGRLYNILKIKLRIMAENIYYCNFGSDKNLKLPSGLLQYSVDECIEKYPNSTYFVIEKLGYPNGIKTYKISSMLNLFNTKFIKDFSLYFWYNINYLTNNTQLDSNQHKELLTVKNDTTKLQIENIDKVIYGITEAHVGNVFVKSLLEVHSDIITMEYNLLNNCLWFYTEELSEKYAVKDIPEKLIDLVYLHMEESYDKLENILIDVNLFIKELKEVLGERKYITAQGLFVAIHIACFYMHGNQYKGGESPIIYWEPHHNSRTKDVTNCYSCWLKSYFKDVYVLKLVRNSIQTVGSQLRDYIKNNISIVCTLELESYVHEAMVKPNNGFIAVRFEDLKLFPRKVLSYLCKVFGITCSEEYLELINTGNLREYNNSQYIIKGLDLRPVYNLYEEYFNSFDIFRLHILFSAKHKAYGYPYQDISIFTKQQILDWFKIPFKFESLLEFGTNDFRNEFRYQMYMSNIRSIELQQYMEDNKDLFCFDDYYKITK